MRRTIKSRLIAFSLLSTLSGVLVAGAPTSSEFIQDLPALQPIPGVEGSWGWEAPDKSMASYDKFLLLNVEIFLAPDSPYKGINTRQLQAITDTLVAAMKAELEPEYPIVSQPGPGVARMSVAISNVNITKRKKRLLNYTPIGLAVGGVRSLADALSNISLASAMVEAEFNDSVSDERIGVRIATKPWAQARVDAGEMSWETLESAFAFYAKQVKLRMDQTRAQK